MFLVWVQTQQKENTKKNVLPLFVEINKNKKILNPNDSTPHTLELGQNGWLIVACNKVIVAFHVYLHIWGEARI